MRHFTENIDAYRDKIVLRDSFITNSAEVIRRLGVIAINTALEVDIFGNVNSSHICGTDMVNGIGGSGDFTRNAHIPIFTTPSVAKNGDISCIVPMVTHTDHTEHDVDVIVTEYGYADLRGKSPGERAMQIIMTCAHPMYRAQLCEYLACAQKSSGNAHIPHNLEKCFDMHRNLQSNGTMSKEK